MTSNIIIERWKASAWRQLCLPLLPFTHARSESINADSLNSNYLQLGRRSGCRPQRTVYPMRLPVNTVIHTTLVGREPATFRSLVDCWYDALPVVPPTDRSSTFPWWWYGRIQVGVDGPDTRWCRGENQWHMLLYYTWDVSSLSSSKTKHQRCGDDRQTCMPYARNSVGKSDGSIISLPQQVQVDLMLSNRRPLWTSTANQHHITCYSSLVNGIAPRCQSAHMSVTNTLLAVVFVLYRMAFYGVIYHWLWLEQ